MGTPMPPSTGSDLFGNLPRLLTDPAPPPAPGSPGAPLSGSPMLGPGTPGGQAWRADIAFEGAISSPSSPSFVDPVGRFNNYLAKMGNDYQMMMQERDRQIARSGSSAAAPYNRAIARLEAEITRVREQQARFQEIAETQAENVAQIYSEGQARVPGYQESSVDAITEAFGDVTRPSQFAVASSPKVAAVAGDLAAVGVDEEVADAVVEVVDATEDEIMGYTDLIAQNTRDYVEQGASILDKALQATAAETGFDIEAEAEILHARLENQINEMIQEKQELAAKRSAAVAAARNATMAQFPEGLNYGAAGFKQATAQRFVSEMVADKKILPDDAPMLNQIIDFIHTSPVWDQTQNLRNYSNLRELFFPESVGLYDQQLNASQATGLGQSATARGISTSAASFENRMGGLEGRDDIIQFQSLVGHLSPADRRSLMYIATQGARAIDEASNFYNTSIVGANPSQFEPGSILRSFATFEYETANGPFGQGPWEIWDYATSERAHYGYTPTDFTPEPYSGFSGVY